MIYKHSYTHINDRQFALDYLESRKFSSVLDVGASYNLWGHKFVTHTLDFSSVDTPNIHSFVGNMCEPTVWETVSSHLGGNKFDFSICTHTLEDILHPTYVISNLIKSSREGFVAIPSKWIELTRNGMPYKGWVHHRWLFDIIDGVLVCVPKLPYLEYIDTSMFAGKPEELNFFWKDTLPVAILNDDFIGPNEESYMRLVHTFLSANL